MKRVNIQYSPAGRHADNGFCAHKTSAVTGSG